MLRLKMQALQAKLQKDGEVMSESERRKAIKDLESMQADLQFGSQKLQKKPRSSSGNFTGIGAQVRKSTGDVRLIRLN